MYKNWDNVRDRRIYAYANEQEMAQFLEAMRIQDIEQQATAARQFIIERSQQIIEQHRKKKTAVTYQFSYRNNSYS